MAADYNTIFLENRKHTPLPRESRSVFLQLRYHNAEEDSWAAGN